MKDNEMMILAIQDTRMMQTKKKQDENTPGTPVSKRKKGRYIHSRSGICHQQQIPQASRRYNAIHRQDYSKEAKSNMQHKPNLCVPPAGSTTGVKSGTEKRRFTQK